MKYSYGGARFNSEVRFKHALSQYAALMILQDQDKRCSMSTVQPVLMGESIWYLWSAGIFRRNPGQEPAASGEDIQRTRVTTGLEQAAGNAARKVPSSLFGSRDFHQVIVVERLTWNTYTNEHVSYSSVVLLELMCQMIYHSTLFQNNTGSIKNWTMPLWTWQCNLWIITASRVRPCALFDLVDSILQKILVFNIYLQCWLIQEMTWKVWRSMVSFSHKIKELRLYNLV